MVDHVITIKKCAIGTDRAIKIEIWVILIIHLIRISDVDNRYG